MKKSLAIFKSTVAIGAVLTCATLLIGCAGNGVKPGIDMKPSATVQPEKPSPAPLMAEQTQSTELAARIKNNTEKQTPAAEIGEVVSVVYPDIDIAANQKPDQRVFLFGFDEAELGDKDQDIIKQHAKYLLGNPEVIVKVVGHTDHHGPKAYNEYLSKKRAEAVIAILLAEGVMESQIEIKAMADDTPLESAEHARDNRRVELEFEQMDLAIK